MSFLMSSVAPESTSLSEEAEGPVKMLLSVRGETEAEIGSSGKLSWSHSASQALKLDPSSVFTE